MVNIVKNFTKETGLNKIGIYSITHEKCKNKIYIGSTKCKKGFTGRWYAHIRHLKRKTHYSDHLQNTINKYGLNGDFIKEWDTLTEAATYFNYSFGTFSTCCRNTRSVKENMFFYEYKGEKIEPYRQIRASEIKIAQIDKEGNIINIFPSIMEAHRITKMSYFQIKKHLKKEIKTIKQFTFKYL